MEFDDVIVKEKPGLCRCCLSEGCYKELGTEYIWMGENEVYADMLLECFDISISQNNEGPNGSNRFICEVCITRLRDACNFKKQVLESEKRFVDMVGRGDFKYKVTVDVLDEGNLKLEQNTEEQIQETAEFEFLEEPIAFDDELNDDVTAEPLSVKGKRGRPKKSIKTVKKKDEKPKTSKPKGSTNEESRKKMQSVQKHMIKRRNIEYVLQYSNATPFLFYKGRYRCFFCTEPIKEPDTLREHTKRHEHANLELIIYDRTKSNRNLDAAVKIDIRNLTCKICSQYFGTLEELVHHLIIAHDAEYDTSVPNCFLPFNLDRDQPTCAICGMKFVFFEYLLRHANKQHLSHDYICDVCGTSFQGENHLRMHNRYYHRDGGYMCTYCGIRLETLSKKSLHEKNVHFAKLHTCQFCPEIFKSPYFKKLHLANVHGVAEMRIKCPYCTKVFPQESLMSRHMRRVHLRERNVECPICGDRFFGPYDVKLHLRKHNGDKNFVCTVCGKKFSKKCNLNAHSVVHTGRKDFACSVCGKEFAHRPNLRIHYRTLHPEYVEGNAVTEANTGSSQYCVVEETL